MRWYYICMYWCYSARIGVTTACVFYGACMGSTVHVVHELYTELHVLVLLCMCLPDEGMEGVGVGHPANEP